MFEQTIFKVYEGTDVVQIFTEVENISTSENYSVEEVSAFALSGFERMENSDRLYFTRFIQSHHVECQPYRQSFPESGLFNGKMYE